MTVFRIIVRTLLWCHVQFHGVTNHSNSTNSSTACSGSTSLPLGEGIHPWPMYYHRKGLLVMRKVFTCHDVIILKPQHPISSLQWRHDEHDSVSNHKPHACLLNRLFKAQIKENIKAPRHWWPVTSEFPAQRASNAENISIWWRHHDIRDNNFSAGDCFRPTHWKAIINQRSLSNNSLHHIKSTVCECFLCQKGLRSFNDWKLFSVQVASQNQPLIPLRTRPQLSFEKNCLVVKKCLVVRTASGSVFYVKMSSYQ